MKNGSETKYQVAVNLFTSEGQIQWSRYSAILIINTILIGLIGLNYDSSYKELPSFFKDFLQFMPLIGILICALWFFMTWKGFRWIQFWIKEANRLEESLGDGINPIQEGALKQSKFFRTEYAAYLVILIFLLIYLYISPFNNIWLPIVMSINLSTLQFSEIFNNFAVGLGALLAGGGGFKILYDWTYSRRERVRRERLRAELRAKYPPNQHKITYRLIESDVKPGWVYLHDLKSGKRHHIASMLTLLRLGYLRDWVRKITPKQFFLIPEGDEFLTDGERYS